MTPDPSSADPIHPDPDPAGRTASEVPEVTEPTPAEVAAIVAAVTAAASPGSGPETGTPATDDGWRGYWQRARRTPC